LIVVMVLFWFAGPVIGPLISGPTDAMFDIIVGSLPY
jgi:hypothetical protein